jgi:hypothetical protein
MLKEIFLFSVKGGFGGIEIEYTALKDICKYKKINLFKIKPLLSLLVSEYQKQKG